MWLCRMCEQLKLAKSLKRIMSSLRLIPRFLCRCGDPKKKTKKSVTPILNQISELSRSFLAFTINHVKRDPNMAAHITAKSASLTNLVMPN